MIKNLRRAAMWFVVIGGLFSLTYCGRLVADDLASVELDHLNLDVRWTAQTVLNAGRDKIRHVTNDEELVFVQSTAGVVTALNAENGRRMWSAQVGLTDEFSMAAVTNKDTILIVTGPVVNGLNKFTGDELFQYHLSSQPSDTPAMDEYSFFIPLMDGSVAGYSLKTLTHLERFGNLPAGVARPMAWRFVCGDRVRFSPVPGTEAIAVATESGSLHAMHGTGAQAGKALYQLLLRSPMSAPLVSVRRGSKESLIAVSADNRVFSIGFTRGARMLWTWPLSRPVTETPVAIGDDVFITTNGSGLIVLSLDEGRPQTAEDGTPWNVANISAVLAVSAGRVYAVDNNNLLLAIDRKTGQVAGRVSAHEHPVRVRNSLTDRIFLSTAAGGVVCLAEKDSDFATYHQNPERQPVAPVFPDAASNDPGGARPDQNR